MHSVEIKNFGPIKDCKIDIQQFTVLTGAQAVGKSTIAKVIYFFMSVDELIYSCIISERYDKLLKNVKTVLLNRFVQIFGREFINSEVMSVKCTYKVGNWIRIFVRKTGTNPRVTINFSGTLNQFIALYENVDIVEFQTPEERKDLVDKLINFFDSRFLVIYIPAGRSITTVLTDYLGEFITTSFNASDNKIKEANLDFCTRNYFSRVLSMRRIFSKGAEEFLTDNIMSSGKTFDMTLPKKFIGLTKKILKGDYIYQNGGEFLRLEDDNRHLLKINHASSGQQEIVWVCNIMLYYLTDCLLNGNRTFLILEEPEAHLYPDSQKYIAELLGMFVNVGNRALITTHSPYILGAINNLICASKIKPSDARNNVTDKDAVLSYESAQAFFVENGTIKPGMEDHEILNELIDGASELINREYDRLMELKWNSEVKNGD